MPGLEEDTPFWTAYQPGMRFSSAAVGSVDFFDEVEAHRYALEPHILDIVQFERWRGLDVLEAGCGIATDGVRFARAGARYVGVDPSHTALSLARRRFTLESLPGELVEGSVTSLPFPDQTFDLVFSHGVIHHIDNTERAVTELNRVLRPGGTALVMVYHRHSLNYYVNILLLRRLAVALLLIPQAHRALAPLTPETPELLAAHRRLLQRHGRRYLTDRQLFVNNNTDGPGNPLSKVYSRAEAKQMLIDFNDVRIELRFLNLRLYPWGKRLAASALGRRLERVFGWYLYAAATKPGKALAESPS